MVADLARAAVSKVASRLKRAAKAVGTRTSVGSDPTMAQTRAKEAELRDAPSPHTEPKRGQQHSATKQVFTPSASENDKSTSKGPAAKKAAPAVAKQASTTASSARKTPAKKTAAQSPTKKSAVKKSAVKKTAATKATAKKATAKKATTKKATAQKATGKKATSQTNSNTSVVSKSAARKTAAKKKTGTPSKKAPEVNTSKQKTPSEDSRSQHLLVGDQESPWTKEELAAIQSEIEADIVQLRQEVSFAEADLVDLMRDSGDGAGDDQADAGAKTYEREQEISVANNARELLEQNEHALERLKKGRYGICETCGQPIGKLRLQAAPRATLCLPCKTDEERR